MKPWFICFTFIFFQLKTLCHLCIISHWIYSSYIFRPIVLDNNWDNSELKLNFIISIHSLLKTYFSVFWDQIHCAIPLHLNSLTISMVAILDFTIYIHLFIKVIIFIIDNRSALILHQTYSWGSINTLRIQWCHFKILRYFKIQFWTPSESFELFDNWTIRVLKRGNI